MSDRERIREIVDKLPDDKLIFVLTYLQGLEDGLVDEPNNDTISALKETDEALKNGKIHPFTGSTDEFLNDLLAED